MAGPYTYTGGRELTYPSYMDAATQRMLIGSPDHDGPYDMFPVDAGLPVPPPDGRWTQVQDAPVAGEPAAAPAYLPDALVPEPAPELAPAPEGGEE